MYAHGPWFLKTYGSLAIWNTQGMEKSHYRAKAAYFKNSRHGGGKGLSNALVEIFQWFYRGVLSRQNIEETRARGLTSMISSSNLARRAAWKSSTANARHREWRMSRVRVGKRWVPRQRTSNEEDGISEIAHNEQIESIENITLF